MKIVVATLVVLVGLGVAADLVARNVAETQIADRIERSLDLGDEPDVSIGGFPFILNLLGGSIPSIEVASGPVARGSVTFDEVSLTLDNVRFDTAALSGGGGAVRIGGGRGRATMSDDNLSALLRAEGAPVEVRFAGERVFVKVDGVEGEADGRLALEGRRLVVSSEALPEQYGVALPAIGSGASYRSVQVRAGAARLVLALRAGSLEV